MKKQLYNTKFKVKALGIIKDTENKTIGAKFRNINTGESMYLTTNVIAENKNNIQCINATIDKNGFIKANFGHKLSIFYTLGRLESSIYYKIPSDIDKRITHINFGTNKKISNILNTLRISCLERARDRNNSAEVGVVLNTETLEYAFIYGTYKRVSLKNSSEAGRILRTSNKNTVVMIHNHPNNSILSKGDLDKFISYDSLYAIEAIGNLGDTYLVYKQQNFNKDEINRLEDILDDIVCHKESISTFWRSVRECTGIVYTFNKSNF